MLTFVQAETDLVHGCSAHIGKGAFAQRCSQGNRSYGGSLKGLVDRLRCWMTLHSRSHDFFLPRGVLSDSTGDIGWLFPEHHVHHDRGDGRK